MQGGLGPVPVVTSVDPPSGTEALAVEWIRVAAPGLGVMPAAVARPRGAGPSPTVVLLHGSHGFAQEYVRLAQDLAEGGVLAVAACWFRGSAQRCALRHSHRLSGGATHADCVEPRGDADAGCPGPGGTRSAGGAPPSDRALRALAWRRTDPELHAGSRQCAGRCPQLRRLSRQPFSSAQGTNPD